MHMALRDSLIAGGLDDKIRNVEEVAGLDVGVDRALDGPREGSVSASK